VTVFVSYLAASRTQTFCWWEPDQYPDQYGIMFCAHRTVLLIRLVLRPEVNVLDLFRNRERSGNDELPKNLPLAALGSSPTRYARKGQSKPSIEAPKPKPKPKMDAIKATSTEPTHGAAKRKAPVVDEGSETREPQKRPKAGLMDTSAHVDTDNLSTRTRRQNSGNRYKNIIVEQGASVFGPNRNAATLGYISAS
jgi:hypothetical protein